MASYLNPANLLNLAPEIVHRFFNAYQAYLPREEDFVDVVERWALVDDKPERLLDTLHATNRDLYPDIYSIISILLAMPVSSATSDRYFSEIRPEFLLQFYKHRTTVQYKTISIRQFVLSNFVLSDRQNGDHKVILI